MTKVTLEEVEAAIAKEEYIHIGRKTSIYLLTLKNGFEVVGISGCIDPKEYDSELGKKYAREKAIDKVWELLGFEKQPTVAEAIVEETVAAAYGEPVEHIHPGYEEPVEHIHPYEGNDEGYEEDSIPEEYDADDAA